MRWATELVIIGDESRNRLAERAARLSAWCTAHADVRLKDVSFSINSEPREQPSQLAIVASSVEDLAKKLVHAATRLRHEDCQRINEKSGIYYFDEPQGRGNRTAFLFPGEGSQYPNMLSDLCLNFPEVRSCFDLLQRAVHQERGDPSPRDYIFPHSTAAPDSVEGEGQLWQMAGGVEAVLTANRAILALLERLKIVPDAVLGHSTGEYAALLASGALRLENEEELVRCLRDGNRLSQRMQSEGKIVKGSLLAVGSEDGRVVASILAAHRDSAWLAIDNCPRQSVLFARESCIVEVVSELREAGALCQVLPFDRAYHTPLFTPVRQELEKLFTKFHLCTPAIDTYSCASAQLYPTGPNAIRNLLLEQWTSPVRFREAIENMHAAGVRVFIEVGPRGNLTAFVDDILRGAPHLAVPTDLPQKHGLTQLQHTLGRLAANAVSMRLDYLYERRNVKRISFDEGETDVSASRGRASSGRALSLALPVMCLPKGFAPGIPTNRPTVPKVPALNPPPAEKNAAQNGNGKPAARSEFVNEYLETMEQFLDTQQVLLAALSGRRVASAGQRSRPVSADRREISSDSVNAALASRSAPLVKTAAAPPVRTVLEPEPGAVFKTGVAEVLLDLVSSKTGYPREILSLSANLESDLGIDSIKRVEILGAFQKAGLLSPEQMDSALRMKSLQQIVDVANGLQNGNPKGAIPSILPREHIPRKEPYGGEYGLTGKVISLTPGKEVHTVRLFDLEHDLYLKDHALGGAGSGGTALVVLPLTIILESIAQVAALLAPGKHLVQIRDVRVDRWMTLEKGSLRVETFSLVSTDMPLTIKGSMREVSADPTASPTAEATFVFGEPIAPPPATPFRLSFEQPSRLGPHELYSHGMFHGPAFQCVRSIERVGAEGIEATLKVPATTGLFSTLSDPEFLTSPILLDAAGQLVGFWAADMLSRGYVVFPFRIRSLEWFGRIPSPGAILVGRAQIAQAADVRLIAELEVLDSENSLLMRVSAWEDKRIDMPDEFFQFRIDPVHNVMSREWPILPRGLPANHEILMYRLGLDSTFLRADGGVWRNLLAHLVLGPRELDSWKALASECCSARRLMGRVVAKDAVRAFLPNGWLLHPASVEILSDENGGPYLPGGQMIPAWPKPVVSISHSDNLAVAVVADGTKYKRLGVNVGSLQGNQPELGLVLCSEAERLLALEQGTGESQEWTLRIWCAKRAIVKALGSSLARIASDLTLCGLDADAESVSFEARGDLLAGSPGVVYERATAYTVRADELIVAIAARSEDGPSRDV